LTKLGEIVRPHLQEIWQQSHSAKTHAQDFMSVSSSRLKLGILCTISPAPLIDLLVRARHRHQTIELEIVEGTASDLEDQLTSGRIGAAIYGKPDARADARFDRIPLFRERMLIAMAKNHKLAGRAALRVTNLAGEAFIRRPRCEFNDVVESLLRQHQVAPGAFFSCERDDWALALITHGFGIGVLPEHATKRAGILAKPLADLDTWQEVDLVTLKGRPHNQGLAALVHEARQGRTET
jgi:DNA-binding transcriptional LysR family regulator